MTKLTRVDKLFLKSVPPTYKDFKGDKNDKVNDDRNKSFIGMVEVFEGKQEKISSESDVESLLFF